MESFSKIQREFLERPWHVWVLAPKLETDDATLQYYYDYSQALSELPQAFEKLGICWSWHPVSSENYAQEINQIIQKKDRNYLILNMCDGDDVNNVPGVSIVKLLAKNKIQFTGAREPFYVTTSCKIAMKNAFDKAMVKTPEWMEIDGNYGEVCTLGLPLIVKPALSGGSMGITLKSVVHNQDELKEQVQVLKSGCHGWNTAARGIYAEKFIPGREFTALIVGSSARPEEATLYDPVERVFDPSLSRHERFLSFDRVWEFYENEAPLPGGAPLYNYGAVQKQDLKKRIKKLSFDAYAAVQGTGYGRVDLRLDENTNELFVLEVNAQCGLSEDENFTSIGAILRLENRSFSELLLLIMMEGVRESQ